ncbi:MAG: radical SAM protein [bacterium]
MIKQIRAKSILRKHKKIDSWFLTHYGINLYRGCSHNCAYCDGRSEKYQVQGEYGEDIAIKVNAVELLAKELDPRKKRKPMPQSFMMLGGGVCDAYQPVETDYQLARKTLELFLKFKYPVHILTKSTLVQRDIDLLQAINKISKVIVSFSFSSADENISNLFEPGVPYPGARLDTIKKLKKSGINCGMFLMPVIPFITDSEEIIKQTLDQGKQAGIDFVIFGTMTLKPGIQKQYFMNVLRKNYPKLITPYQKIYALHSPWGEPNIPYRRHINQIFNKAANQLKIPKRIPPWIYDDVISLDQKIIVILDHLDYLIKLTGQKSPYGYASYSLSKINQSISHTSPEKLLKLNGIGPFTLKIIEEIIETGTSQYYLNLL